MMIQHVALFVLSKKFTAASVFLLSVLALTVDPMVFAAAAVIIIAAIAAAAVSIINALGNAKKELLVKQAEIMAQGTVIQGHVDGMTTAAAAKRTADEDTISALRHQLAESEQRAVLLAQAKAN